MLSLPQRLHVDQLLVNVWPSVESDFALMFTSKGVPTMQMYYCYTDSPVGKLLLAGDFHGLKLLNFQNGPAPILPESSWRKDAAYFVNAIMQLQEYFAGQREKFALRLNPDGTDFQRAVLDAVSRIPYGETATYADIARLIKNPKSTRAVGAANGRNPLPIFIPCHRVIGSNGKLTGFNGGIERKSILLALERGQPHQPENVEDVQAELFW